MSFEFGIDDDPHEECRHHIRELEAETDRLQREVTALRKQVEQLGGFASGLIHQLSAPFDRSVELRRRLAAILEEQTDE